jgi:hypothetical protein
MTRHKGIQKDIQYGYGFAGLSPPFNPWLASAGPMFEAAAQLTTKMCEGVAEVGKELAEFTARRVQEDLRLPARLATCKSPQDVQQVYVDFWTTAFAQYQAEFGRLAEVNQAFSRAATTKFGQAVEGIREIKIAA